MALNADDTLLNGHYRIIRQLGRGGFGFVYLAQDTLLGEQVAIKELIPALVGDETMLKRFLAEARATMRLTHERIVRTHNVFREGGNYYIVMECMAGDSLEARLRGQGPLPVDEAVQVAAEVCEGLAHAHERGVVHCDLKPANILFDSHGRAKVADFGIAHVSGEMLTRTWHTPQGFVAGTLPYMSPEQADGVRDDPRIDVYAVGAVLYRMLTGRTYLEFDQRETPGAQADNVYRIRNLEPQPPSTHMLRLPPWVDGVVLRALAKQPQARYANAEALRAALLRQQIPALGLPATKLVSESRAPASMPTPARQAPAAPAASDGPAATRVPARPVWFWPAAGAVVVLVVFLIVAIAALGRGGDGGTAAGGETATDATAAATTVATQALTDTPEPPSVSTETDSPVSTFTDSPQPTLTRTKAPTATRRPTANPTSTRTRTPEPTATSTSTPVPPSSTPKPKGPAAGATRTRTKDGMVTVYVPAGAFTMGDSNGMLNEKPAHTVTLDAFWIDKTEVTNAQYRRCVEAGACTAPSNTGSYSRGSYYGNSSFDNYPVIWVNWNQANAYCRWAGARLPTEAEWEKAARGTDGRDYPWGNQVADCNRANCSFKDAMCVGDTSQVGSYPTGASAYGALDMGGNVYEWVADWFGDSYYANSPANNPKGPDSGSERVTRGGCWVTDGSFLRVVFRGSHDPASGSADYGIRCAGSSGE